MVAVQVAPERKARCLFNENDFSIGAGITAPRKYLMKGPPELHHGPIPSQARISRPYHNIMEENFHILQGKVDIVVDGEVHTLSAGDFIHIEPAEGPPPSTIASQSSWSQPLLLSEVDKVEVEDPTTKFIIRPEKNRRSEKVGSNAAFFSPAQATPLT